MKKIILIVTILFSTILIAQENYKYVIIPSQFSFFKEANKYNLNSLTKSFFESEGFTVFYDTDDLPVELNKNRCLALYGNAVENNSMFVTRITVVIRDCKNNVLVTSNEGTSKVKDYDRAYTQSLRSALTSLKGKLNLKPESEFIENEGKSLPKKPSVLDSLIPEPKKIIEGDKNLLYALPTEYGFKLVNATPSVIFELQKTSIADLFLAERGMMDNGIFYKKEDIWYYEYYNKEKLVIEKVEVKF